LTEVKDTFLETAFKGKSAWNDVNKILPPACQFVVILNPESQYYPGMQA
jgi:hypothetical protein